MQGGRNQLTIIPQGKKRFLLTAAVAGNFERPVIVNCVVANKESQQHQVRIVAKALGHVKNGLLVCAPAAHAGIEHFHRLIKRVCQQGLQLFVIGLFQVDLEGLAKRVGQG